MELEVLQVVVVEDSIPESTVKKEPVVSFEEWDANRLSECTDLLLA